VAITFGGLASGLPPNLVDQLVEAERMPIRNIELRKAKSENKIKLLGELDGKLSAITGSIGDLASTRGFADIKMVSGDPNVIQGTVDPGSSVNGSWNVEVVELAQKSSAITNGFPDKDKTEIGVGYFEFQTSEGKKSVYINGENNTLEKAAAAINNAGVGLKASVINDRKDPDAPFKLIISGQGTGDESHIKFPTLYFLDGDQDIYFDDKKEAKNGIIKVDGIEMQISDNKVIDAIPGVTLDIRQASPGKSVNISVSEDREVVAGKIKSFVDSVNATLGFIQAQTPTKDTDTSQTLGGESVLRSIEARLRRLLQNPIMGVGGSINRLSQLGIQFNRNGTLDFKEESFNKALASDPTSVQMFFAGDGFSTGFIPALRNTLAGLSNPSFGPVAMRKQGLQGQVKRFDDQIESKERQLQRREQTLRRQFARLEETMSRLKSQGSALGAMGAGGGMPNLSQPSGA